MKKTALAAIAVILTVLLVAFLPQETQGQGANHNKRMQMMELMKDSAMVYVMMDHIASNRRMRGMMMQKMMYYAKADSVGMLPALKMMSDDQEIRGTLTKSIDEQQLNRHGTTQEILIKFNAGVDAAQISALESEVGLKQTNVIPTLNVRVFKITSSKSVKEIIAICEKKPFVKYAEPNHQHKALK